MTAPDNTITEVISMLFIIGTMIVIYKQVSCDKSTLLWSIPMFVFMLHGLIFYISVNLERNNIIDTTIIYAIWSSFLRLHGYITIFILETFRLLVSNKRLGKCG